MNPHDTAIHDGLAAGKSWSQIARELGLAKSTIIRWAQRRGLQSGHHGGGQSFLSAADIEIARKRSAAGDSYRTIAKAFGCSYSAVARGLKRLERPRPEPVRPEPVPIEALDVMFAAKRLSVDIARTTGIPLEAVLARRKGWTSQRLSELQKARGRVAEEAPKPRLRDKLGAALQASPLCTDIPDEDIALEDAAWAAGRKVPSLREMRMAA